VAKVKVINTNLDQNLNGTFFNDFPSKTIFTFGSFNVTSNFDGKLTIDYTNTLSSFVRPVTLETMGVTDVQSQILQTYTTNAVLNLDKSDLNTFIRFGSAYEFLRVSIQNIILAYPGSLFANSQKVRGGNITFSGYSYNATGNTATFYIPTAFTTNIFGLVFNSGNTTTSSDVDIKNLNISYNNYVVWLPFTPESFYPIVGFTGNSTNSMYTLSKYYLKVQVTGDPFSFMKTGNTPNYKIKTGNVDFHIKPNNIIFEEYRALLNDYEKYIVSQRNGTDGFQFVLKDPTLLDDGTIIYSDAIMLWTTSDKYNIDINTPNYQKFLQIVLTIGAKYDKIKTDLIARFLTPSSLKTYDQTEEGKITKLLRIYGREFDQLRQFIDSLVYINKVTYDKLNNIPDQLIKNMSRTFGWDYFSLVNENELVQGFLTVNDEERNLNENLLPAEIDIELWRRILNNTNYFWKSKGTREAIKSMFLLIGIPEPFINITEYVYTVDGKINPNSVNIAQQDFPSNSLPYDTSGYPVAPLETNDFYFQISGDTDSGQAYLDVFRMAGFNLSSTVDNKKSWIQTGATTRIHYDTPQYYQKDSKLVINTKEVDIALDMARGIEYDVYDYIKNVDFPANNSGYTLPYSYVNISLDYTGTSNTFQLPTPYDKTQGYFEVRYNGILLNAPRIFNPPYGYGSDIPPIGMGNLTAEEVLDPEYLSADYSVSGNSFTILNGNYATNSNNRRDVIEATFIYSGGTRPVTGITIQYIVTRIKPQFPYTYIPLPSFPRGDVQVTINGIALTKGTSQFTADYIIDPNNTTGHSQIILQNTDVISFLAINPEVQVAYVEVHGSNDINARSEVVRIDSFNNSKIYFNLSANKYVYKLNYKANKASDIKFLVDGIALEPYRDYDINVMNPYEVYLPNGLRYGNVLSAYYLVGGNAAFTPVVSDSFGIGDISKLSFLEFIELIQRKMINARNRKTISDFKGGWYPALLRIYEMYLQRALLPTGDTLHSNGYTFENLYSFLSKYNAFFQKFVDQLLSATIILKKGGLLIRNTVFTKQKFMYKRGVNVSPSGTTYYYNPEPNPYDYGNSIPPIGVGNLTYRGTVQYLGDDGAMFIIKQNPEPSPIDLYVETKAGTAGIGSMINIGGKNITGLSLIREYGVMYKKSTSTTWTKHFVSGKPSTNSFSFTINGLLEGTVYNYKAVVHSDVLADTGNTLSLKTLSTPPPTPPSGKTKQSTSSSSSALYYTGGYAIQRYADVQWYGMQYRPIGSTATFNVTPTLFTNIPATSQVCNVTIVGEISNTFTVSAVCGVTPITWLTPQTPAPPTPAGITQSVTIQSTTVARTGCTIYTPTVGIPKIVVFEQNGVPQTHVVNVITCTGGYCYPTNVYQPGTITPPNAGDCYYVNICYYICKGTSAANHITCVCVKCNGTTISGWNCSVANLGKGSGYYDGSFGTKLICHSDNLQLFTCAISDNTKCASDIAELWIGGITNSVGTYTVGSPYLISETTSNISCCCCCGGKPTPE
jgi:hypothetical protein